MADPPATDKAAHGLARLVLDVTGIAGWVGPPVGILRVEQELARYALAARRDVVLAFHDRSFGFRPLRPEWAATIIGWQGIVDPFAFAGPQRPKRGPRRFMPSRYPVVMALEHRRLSAGSALMRRFWDGLQRLVFFGSIPPPFADKHGQRIAVVAPDRALGPPLRLGPDDVLVIAGMDWLRREVGEIAALKQRHGFRCVALCYDLIPIFHPEFFAEHHVVEFRRYWTRMFALAERIIVTSSCIAGDVRRHCAATGMMAPAIDIIPLGYRPREPAAAPALLPAGLEAGRYALFVSTIEPRKGHGMLLRAWRRLLAEGVPQRHRFRLVFVGRRGWMVDAVLADLDRMTRDGSMVVHLADLDDTELDGLYRGAAFSLYPSIYEGFGLPILESFSYGKAVLASTGGAVPETVAGRSPCLDPGDEEAWYRAIGRWIEDPAARGPYEDKIRTQFAAPSWDEAAARFFDAAARAVGRPAGTTGS